SGARSPACRRAPPGRWGGRPRGPARRPPAPPPPGRGRSGGRGRGGGAFAWGSGGRVSCLRLALRLDVVPQDGVDAGPVGAVRGKVIQGISNDTLFAHVCLPSVLR